MKYLLDTNTCIRYLNRRSETIIRRFSSLVDTDITICSIVKAELFAGAAKSNDPVKTLAKQQTFLNRYISLPFDDAAALIYGSIRAGLEIIGKPIGPNDLFIAAIAIANDLILVTHNMAEFSRIDGLKIEDWEI